MNVWIASLAPGGVVALIAGLFTVWQARVGIRPAERAGFRADFQAFVAELKEDNEKLEAKVASLEAKIDEQNVELRALGGYTRQLVRELQRNDLSVPAYTPPPDLTKHLV